MIMGMTWTHLESVWNPPQTSNWSGTIFCRFLQQTGSTYLFMGLVELLLLHHTLTCCTHFMLSWKINDVN